MSESVVILNPLRVAGGSISLDSALLGAFGRQRTAEPHTLWDTQFQYDKRPDEWEEMISGAGASTTHLPLESSILFTVGTGAGDYVIRQTHQYLRYKPGKSQLIIATGVLGAPKDGVEKSFGYGDDYNGVFVRVKGDGVYLVLRSNITGSVVDTEIHQEDWNKNKLLDPALGPVLDPTKAQILVIDLEWLGVGTVRVGFFIDGQLYYVNYFNHANVISSVYMTTANLPLRYEVRNDAVTPPLVPTTDFKQICSTVISEGGSATDIGDQLRAQETPIGTPVTVPDSAIIPVLSIRLNALINGIPNRGTILPLGLDMLIVASKNVYWEIAINPTINATVWTDVGSSIAQYNLDATTTTGGRKVLKGFAAGTNQSRGFSPLDIPSKLRLARNFNNSASDILTLQCRSIDSPSSNVYAAIQWLEYF